MKRHSMKTLALVASIVGVVVMSGCAHHHQGKGRDQGKDRGGSGQKEDRNRDSERRFSSMESVKASSDHWPVV